jgi:eukaryotic-like serine/threonine-protein kinase
MPGAGCVSEPDLRAFVLGELPERLAGPLAAHLELCPACEQAARLLDSLTDPLLDSLRLVFRPAAGNGPTRPEGPAGSLTLDHRPDPAAAQAPAPQVPGYEVLAELGRGGMGVVYLARQARPARLVALKVILAATHADAERRARFLAEADAIARLRHPHIVQVYQVGQHGGVPFLALEFVGGGTLAQRLAGGPLPPRQAAQLLEALARAVQHAHRHGVVHRDLKPANVLLTEEGQPKVADFGLARQPGPALTATGAVLGTPSYMAPEQAAGEAVGPAADVYALGAVLYEALTGRPPFRAASALETLGQVRTQEPVAPSQLQPATPRDLNTLCLKCLEKEPGRRYPSAGELADDLRRFLQGEPVRARPVGAAERAWRWARRRPAAAALVLVSGVALAALVGVATSLWYSGRLRGALDQAEQARRGEERANYFHRITLANLAWRDGNVRQVLQLLDACPEEHRRWEWYYLRRLCFPELRRIAAHDGPIRGIAFSPDGRQLASAGNDLVKVWDFADGRQRLALAGHTDQPREVAFSPDGSRLASSSVDGTVRVWDVATGRPPLILRGHTREVQGVAFSPDGALIASAGLDRTARVWDARDGRPLRTLATGSTDIAPLAFSPDGRRLATACVGKDQVIVWAVPDGKRVLSLDGFRMGICSVAFSPDGRRLAAGGLDRVVKVWDRATRQAVLSLGGHTEFIWRLAFDPAGRRLAVACTDGSIKVWDLATGRELATLRGHSGNVYGVVFQPGGHRLVSAGFDGTIRTWDPTASPGPMALRGHERGVNRVAFHPRSNRVASAGADGTVRVWDAATGEEWLALRGHARGVGVAFSPGGHRLASTEGAGGIRIWDLNTGRSLLTLNARAGDARNVSFSPDGKKLATGDHAAVRVWDAEGGRLLLSLKGHTDRANGVAFSPDGRLLASGGADRTVRAWDLSTGWEEFCLEGHTAEVHGVAFSPDGTRLASACGDETVGLWDVASGKLERRLTGHTAGLVAVAFSPDGTRLASASFDRTVRLWDPDTGDEVLSLKGHTGGLTDVAFSPDGTRLVTASHDGTALIWDARPVRPEDGVGREALALVRRLVPEGRSRADVLGRIRADTMIGEAVRREALEFAQAVWAARLRQRAFRRVQALFGKPRGAPEVRELLRRDGALNEEERQAALEVVGRWPQDPGR